MILFGYLFMITYLIKVALIAALHFRRFSNKRSQRKQISALMRSISKVKFSEELFGAMGDENECIICMTSYKEDDMITKLNCNANHYYHTSCIEQWI